MSTSNFSKLNSEEKESRLLKLGSSKETVTLWIKGQETRFSCRAIFYHKSDKVLAVDFPNNPFPLNSILLCTFNQQGLLFFSKIQIFKDPDGLVCLKFNDDLFKSERRTSYRIHTYPTYEIWAEFDTGEVYEGGNVVGIKSKTSQTNLFKNFLRLLDPNKNVDEQTKNIKVRVQNLSITGMAIHVGDVEGHYFTRDLLYQNVKLKFLDEVITIPEVKVVYIVDYIGSRKHANKYKVGLQFAKMDYETEEKMGKKVNSLFTETDFDLDFEKFIK